ncbi:hypothetical protein BpHYR1_020221 [Brachionus plicatilis]|uniref:Uncharacterized protein n=1 Tax=Brachionus plicatilis TaxID=10195 RepID=A0A3M7RHU2_BRAPC|nr:hypothetical protein BpHYR1_020221 [Brachionus plicatilis]
MICFPDFFHFPIGCPCEGSPMYFIYIIKLKNSKFLGAQLLFFSIFLKNMLLEPDRMSDHYCILLNTANIV